MDRLSNLPDEALVPWFYRVLRNAAIDRQRRKGVEDRALATFTQELAGATQPDHDLHREICACVGRLARTLKPEYAEVLQAVDVDETPVKTFAEATGLTTSNAGVRLFRGSRSASEAGDGVLWHVRRARLPRLFLPKTLRKAPL
jgi:RNA polymerase sigma-70 factor (ECF subfamily)